MDADRRVIGRLSITLASVSQTKDVMDWRTTVVRSGRCSSGIHTTNRSTGSCHSCESCKR
jgi:hypothetical protein